MCSARWNRSSSTAIPLRAPDSFGGRRFCRSGNGWRVTALELQSKAAIEARQEGLTFACGERFEADGQEAIGPRLAGATRTVHQRKAV